MNTFVVGIILLIGLTAWGAFATWFAWLGLRCRYWPTVECEILEVSENEIHTRNSSYWRPYVYYKFAINGQQHLGSTISYRLHIQTNSKAARTLIAPYTVGSKYPVFYDPSNPKRSVLKPGPSIAMILIAGMGVIALLTGILILMS